MESKPLIFARPNVENIAGASKLTRSGHIFVLTPPQKVVVDEMAKEQGIETLQPHREMGVANDPTLLQGDDEFLKLVKRSDYKVVDQLHQTP